MSLGLHLSNRRLLRTVLLPVLIGLTACATLPAEEATTFRKIATADRDAFVGITQAESDAATAIAIRNVAEGDGNVEPANCKPDDEKPCTLIYGLDGASLSLGQPAAETRRLIGAIAEYGDRMADLAEAKDIDELNGKTAAAGAAVRGLFTAVGLPMLGPIVDAGVLAQRLSLERKRQRLLEAVAARAQDAIDAASTQMRKIAEASRDAVKAAAADAIQAIRVDLAESKAEAGRLENRAAELRRLKASKKGSRWAETMLDSVDRQQRELRERRAEQVAQLVAAARTLNAARELRIDFDKLAQAHRDLREKLANPSISAEKTLVNVNEFLGILDGFAAIGQAPP